VEATAGSCNPSVLVKQSESGDDREQCASAIDVRECAGDDGYGNPRQENRGFDAASHRLRDQAAAQQFEQLLSVHSIDVKVVASLRFVWLDARESGIARRSSDRTPVWPEPVLRRMR